MLAAQGTNNKLYPARALRRGVGHDRASRVTSLRLARALGVIESARPPVMHFRLVRGARGTLR
jgi:hypothetical protein